MRASPPCGLGGCGAGGENSGVEDEMAGGHRRKVGPTTFHWPPKVVRWWMGGNTRKYPAADGHEREVGAVAVPYARQQLWKQE